MVARQISPKIESYYGLGRQAENYKDLYGILQVLRGYHWYNFLQKTLKLGWVGFHSVTFQLNQLIFNLINIRNSSQSSHVSAIGYLE